MSYRSSIVSLDRRIKTNAIKTLSLDLADRGNVRALCVAATSRIHSSKGLVQPQLLGLRRAAAARCFKIAVDGYIHGARALPYAHTLRRILYIEMMLHLYREHAGIYFINDMCGEANVCAA